MKTLIKWLKTMTDPTCEDCQKAIKLMEENQKQDTSFTFDFRLRIIRQDGQRETHIGIVK